ncbi:DUF2335 domain-containing protein [Clostridium tyrobutyricum]|uniref:DUF2335 domain-containing protein n=1 Tax=Clostridium tyrobutyricum TaxID=1519 RepID=UPI001C393AC4|nr:DUF2335 domain-containing protein [Clostridium tyrobutyricum]MBV4417601.1 DUF2335 domain-containing protein [Clostridium tyrobutyricum]
MGNREVPKRKTQNDETAIDGILEKEADMPEVIDESPLKRKDQQRKIIKATSSFFSGPLPSPDIFKQYEEICPGAADRIISMAEKQMDHRQNIENIFLKSRSRNSFIGVIAALIIAICAIISAVVCILNDHSVSGTIFGGIGITTIVVAFLTNTKMTEEKVEKKGNKSKK